MIVLDRVTKTFVSRGGDEVVALDDCVHSVKAVMDFVYSDHEKQFGFGKESPERLAFTWKAVADAQELDASWDPKQAFDTSLVPAN